MGKVTGFLEHQRLNEAADAEPAVPSELNANPPAVPKTLESKVRP